MFPAHTAVSPSARSARVSRQSSNATTHAASPGFLMIKKR